MLKLYYCRLPDSTPAVQTERLSAYRREKIEKQTNERVRLRSLTAELLLRHALRDGGFAVEGPLNIVVSEQGKPFLRDGRCFFSLSHSGERVLCVLSDLACGGDVEQIGRGSPALARRFFTVEENAALSEEASAAGEEAFQRLFARIWTRKESLLKATGDGLSRPLSSFSVLKPDPDVLFLESAPERKYASCVCLLRQHRQTEWPRGEWIPVSLDETFLAR